MRQVAARLANGFKPVESSLDVSALSPDTPGFPSGFDLSKAAKLLKDYPNYACLGAIGPDLFQFLPDFPTHPFLAYVVQYLTDFYGVLDPYMESWGKFAGPVNENTSEFLSQITGGLSEEFQTLSSELTDFLVAKIESAVVSAHDWIGLFSLEMNRGFDEQVFTWMDMLHYRSTTHFGRELWTQASQFNDGGPNPQLQAYALGYVTHLGTDVTGHPFVNAISGGPYREHWHRHHLVEVQSDAFWYMADPQAGAPKTIAGYPEYPDSALYYDISFGDNGERISRPAPPPGGRTLREKYNRKLALDQDSDLPDEIAQLLHDTLKAVYSGDLYPHVLPNGENGFPTTEQIKDAFFLLYKYLKLTTCDSFDHERPSPPEMWGNLDPPTIPSVDLPPGLNDTEYSLLDFAFSLIASLYYIGAFVTWLVTLPVAAIADVATYGIRILLYLVELALYQVVKDARAFLVLMGYLAPTKDEIASGLVQVGTTRAESYTAVRAEMGDVFGGIPATPPVQNPDLFNDGSSPHIHEPAAGDRTSSLEYQHPWSYPQTPAELGETIMSPYAKGADPSVLFNGTSTDPNFRDSMMYLAPDPAATDDINTESLSPTVNLGDAPNFSMYLAWLCTREEGANLENSLVDFNLDGDRGYAYKCWDWVRTLNQDTELLGYQFYTPQTWPSQAGNFVSKDNLQIVYLPRPGKGGV
jgi:hypothetical protein